jgi:transcriptional regulator with XRE-family HTH domain
MAKGKKSRLGQPGRVTLREVAERVGLASGTVSAVLNDAPSARAIPEHTRQRIQTAAQELNYRPNFIARSLRKKRTYTVGLIIEEIGDAYGAMVISGVEAYLGSPGQTGRTALEAVLRYDGFLALSDYRDGCMLRRQQQA